MILVFKILRSRTILSCGFNYLERDTIAHQLGKLLRDKAFTLLAQKESTVREYGRYLFWKDDNKGDRYKL
jgi:hypothetical protein